jgi:hypothetical protein
MDADKTEKQKGPACVPVTAQFAHGWHGTAVV